jgi:septum formation protein
MRIAFKEWAIVVDALGRGEQIIILRKGGIHEGRGGFEVGHQQFLLFPTLYHQQRESVVHDAQTRFDVLAPHFPPPDRVRLEFFADVAAWHRLDSPVVAERLRGQHIWRDDVIAQRYEWGKSKNIFALAVRVHRLPTVVELPMSPAYAGCKSWVELATEIDASGAQPVLSDAAFGRKLRLFNAALESVSRQTKTALPPLILASASPRRAELLRELGLQFHVLPGQADEVYPGHLTPHEICQVNAYRKARVIAKRHPDALVLGADTLVYLGGQRFGKPADRGDAQRMLEALQGQTHQVVTGVCLIHLRAHRQKVFAVSSAVTFRPLNAPEIAEYLSKIQPLDKAGAYALQEYSDLIVENVSGSYSNIVGLPVERLQGELNAFQMG